jgi:hypothetical protein
MCASIESEGPLSLEGRDVVFDGLLNEVLAYDLLLDIMSL